ncbi:MAG: type I glyceraldehyde-3-phosphate dehydrogenase [Magnetococcales bacterium]|nr:type I glyceraldehyde-3-phosphate dehydrogenase [Magnetococcales bacterium]PPR17570.1 MAG: Glyceraldehyde-3-phosphate dehydrogenase [Pseudomonadota bacterium]|tara:strand:+ start:768 stop:1802 length:1035 start_codon:yes stop_codon:yes gene_type:complete
MTVKVAINGFGRIGRAIFRAYFEDERGDIEIVAVNDLSPFETSLHLLKYDSVHGPFNAWIDWVEDADKKTLEIDGQEIKFFAERDPKNLPWKELGVDVVLECTGVFRDKEKCQGHIEAGAQKVLISAPGGSDVDATIVFGVNHETLKPTDTVISNASCTTNCLAPVAKVLNDAIGIEKGLMTTIHAYTADQSLVDGPHSDLRRARAAALSMIPTSTGAAKAVGLVLPELKGKLDGYAMRVPTPNVSVVDLTFTAKKSTTVEEVNAAIQKHVDAQDEIGAPEVLVYTNQPLVSSDFNHTPFSSAFDMSETRVSEDGKLVKVLSWYDNEWGFSNRMLDTAVYFGNL